MSIINWDGEASSNNSYETISDWLLKQNEQSFYLTVINGIQKLPTGEEKEISQSNNYKKIKNIRLEETNLIYNERGQSRNILIKKLELDIKQKQLKVFSSEPYRYIFKEA